MNVTLRQFKNKKEQIIYLNKIQKFNIKKMKISKKIKTV